MARLPWSENFNRIAKNMRYSHILFKMLLVSFCTFFLLRSANALTIKVPQHFATIQLAINAAKNLDTILISEGVYYENLIIKGKEIVLASLYLIDKDTSHISKTIVNGSKFANEDSASVLTILPGASAFLYPQIIGLTLTGGSGNRLVKAVQTPLGADWLNVYAGGGIFVDSMNPIFSYNRIVYNSVTKQSSKKRKKKANSGEPVGGGIYTYQSNPNFGGWVGEKQIYNPGFNVFLGNFAPIARTFFAEFDSDNNDPIYFENCFFDVFGYSDTAVSDYWVSSQKKIIFDNSKGRDSAIIQDVYVSPDGIDGNGQGLKSGKPFKTVSYALSKVLGTAQHPIVIHLAEGIYSPEANGEIFPLQMLDWVYILGSGQGKTILDAQANETYPNRVMIFENVNYAIVDSLTITGGYNDIWNTANSGGGVLCINSNPFFGNVTITKNFAGMAGGGVSIMNGSKPTFKNVTISNNIAHRIGGGMFIFASQPILDEVVVKNNHSNYEGGAGMYLYYSQPNIMNTTIVGNIAKRDNGGAIYMNNSLPVFTNIDVQQNFAVCGGGLYATISSPVIKKSNFANNSAEKGGAMYFINDCSPQLSSVKVVDNNATQAGGGILCWASDFKFDRLTVANNVVSGKGGGLYTFFSSGFVGNSVFWKNNPDQIYISGQDPLFMVDTISLAYNSIQDGILGVYSNNANMIKWLYKNIDKDPMFFGDIKGDYSLMRNSPLLDAGTKKFVINGKVLIDIPNSEFNGLNPDMGSEESPYSTSLDDKNFENTQNELIDVYPNPNNGLLNIRLLCSSNSNIELSLLNVNGKIIAIRPNENRLAGINMLTWNLKEQVPNIASGVYLLICKVNGQQILHRVFVTQ